MITVNDTLCLQQKTTTGDWANAEQSLLTNVVLADADARECLEAGREVSIKCMDGQTLVFRLNRR